MNDNDDDYSNLVSKMFVIIEMDGFGYPIFDLFYYVFNKKGKDMYDATKSRMSFDNIDKEFSEQIDNKEGKSRFELEQSFEKPEMELGDNYSDILAIYWITMFYIPIYPIGIIQTFLNLLFKFILEKNFLLKIYKRPEYINPQFGFLCFNFFNFGFFLFLCGDIIFFKNEDNKKSYGAGYIVIMILILVCPFFLLAKFIMYITKYCGLKKESENLNDIKQKIKSDYRIFNPCYQKEEIKHIFSEFRSNNLLTVSQYKELNEKIDRLNDLDLYKLQKNLRTPKLMSFEERQLTSYYIYENDSKEVKNEEKQKLYNFLMKFGFMPYLEEGNDLRPRTKRFEFFIPNIDLSYLQENLSNSDSGYFTTFKENNKLIIAYVDNERSIKIFDVFHKRILNNVQGLKYIKKIVCIDSFKKISQDKVINYLVSIAIDNTMIISDLSINEKDNNIIVDNIGDKYNLYEDSPNNIFCLSAVNHQGDTWIITSYYYDRAFKIYNSEGKNVYNNPIYNNDEFIISLKGLYLTEENTYICVSSTDGINQRINLFINEHFIKQIIDEKDSYINFNLLNPFEIIEEKKYLIISKIKKDLSSYNLEIKNIYPIFPLYTPVFQFLLVLTNRRVMDIFRKIRIVPGTWHNNEVHTPMNLELKNKIINNSPNTICDFQINYLEDQERRNKMKIFFESKDDEKFNLGNILFWEENYIIVGTPFDYLDIIDYKNKKVIGIIHSTETINSIKGNQDINDIVIYNISQIINDPEYGKSFIMRDNKGKIQYIRPAKIKDKLNYSIIEPNEYFNDLEDDEKLKHILFYTILFFIFISKLCCAFDSSYFRT